MQELYYLLFVGFGFLGNSGKTKGLCMSPLLFHRHSQEKLKTKFNIKNIWREY